jgi:hypothetical protein
MYLLNNLLDSGSCRLWLRFGRGSRVKDPIQGNRFDPDLFRPKLRYQQLQVPGLPQYGVQGCDEELECLVDLAFGKQSLCGLANLLQRRGITDSNHCCAGVLGPEPAASSVANCSWNWRSVVGKGTRAMPLHYP